MSVHQPNIGEWYRIKGGDLFEVVAVDEDDDTVELQHFDGTVEELELADWHTRFSSGAIIEADAPEDWSGSADQDREDEGSATGSYENDRRLNASELDGIDLFE
jgi:hypothetical protein